MSTEQHNTEQEESSWTLVPYEAAFTREWYVGGIGDLRLPFVVSGREAIVGAAVGAVCMVLVLLGAGLTLIGFVGMFAIILPRMLRDRAFDGRMLQGFVWALVVWKVRPQMILPSGKRIREFGTERVE